jgi:hypothetical protein
MAKRARELAVKERRERKLAKKAARAHQAELATGSIVAVAASASADAGGTPTPALDELRGRG